MAAIATTQAQFTATVPEPVFILLYGQKDITHDVTPYVTAVSFTDKLSGESDEIQVELEDSDGRWCDAWYPGKGDTLSLKMGYVGEPLLDCGTFSIDEIELNGSPDTVSIRGLAASVSTAMRTKSNRGFENTTLAAIASRIAKKHDLQLVGQIEQLKIDRVTQYAETDLAFVKRLATEYGYMVKVTHTQLIFSHLLTLRDVSPVRQLRRTDLSRFSFRDTINRIYKNAKGKHQNSKTKTLVTVGVQADGDVGKVREETTSAKRGKSTSADTLQLTSRAHNKDEAEIKTRAALNLKNQYQKVATLSLDGHTTLKAGNNLELLDFGQCSGVWLIASVRHSLDRSSGCVTELEVVRGPVSRPDKKNASKSTQLVVVGQKSDGSMGQVGSTASTKKKGRSS